MKKSIVAFSALFLITILGAFLRFYAIGKNPPSLNGDEVSFGYSAYSVSKTGRDENGKFMPLVFQSIGDYKNPVPVYLMIAPIELFGVNNFAVRFNNALFGTLFIPVFYFFLLYIFGNKKISILGSFFMSISMWYVFFSRQAYEGLVASFFILLGIWFFMKVFDGKWKFIFPSAFFLVLTMYTAFAPRMFIPFFLIGVCVLKYKYLIRNWKKSFTFGVDCFVLVLPLLYVTLFGGAGTRFSMVFLAGDVDFARYVLLRNFGGLKDVPYLFFFWAKRYLNYLNLDFWFFNGLHMTSQSKFGLGPLYLYEAPFFLLGVWKFLKTQIRHKGVFAVWILAGLIPDSITNNEQHAGRLIHIAPVLIVFIILGFTEFVHLIRRIKGKFLKVSLVSLYCCFILAVLVHAYLTVSVHFPIEKGETYNEGLEEVSNFVWHHSKDYNEVIYDTRHGVDGPYIAADPFLYLLFYSKFDPAIYQTIPKTYGSHDDPYFKFDKYVFTYINWPKDAKKKNTLFVGSPWSFPADIIKQGKVLKIIYLTNGSPAYYIVSN